VSLGVDRYNKREVIWQKSTTIRAQDCCHRLTNAQPDVSLRDYSEIQKIILVYMGPHGPTFSFTRCYTNANLLYF
jgi:hypothetical protein